MMGSRGEKRGANDVFDEQEVFYLYRPSHLPEYRCLLRFLCLMMSDAACLVAACTGTWPTLGWRNYLIKAPLFFGSIVRTILW